MPLHLPGVDETTFKNLAKRYRKIVEANNKKTNQPTPSLMQIQEDLVRALGHKDMHAAQAHWKRTLSNDEIDMDDINPEDPIELNDPMDDMDSDPWGGEEAAFMAHRKLQVADEFDQSWDEAIKAMTEGASAFTAWVKDNAVTVVKMRNNPTRYDLLAFAVMNGYDFAANVLEQLGDQLTFKRMEAAMGWEKDRFHPSKIARGRKGVGSVQELDRFLAKLDGRGCQLAILHMSGDYQRYPELSTSQFVTLLQRVGTPQPSDDRYQIMTQIEKMVVLRLSKGHADVLEPWKQLLASSPIWQWTVGSCANCDPSAQYWHYMISKGQLSDVQAFESQFDPLTNIPKAMKEHADTWEFRKPSVSDLCDGRLIAAASSGSLEMLNYVLQGSQHSDEGLQRATYAACVGASDEIVQTLFDLGGKVAAKEEQFLARSILKQLSDITADECLIRLQRVANLTNNTLAGMRDFSGGNIAHMMVSNFQISENPEKSREILMRLIEDHQLDINMVDKEGMTAVARAARFMGDAHSAHDISFLMSVGGNPAISNPKSETSLIIRFASSSDDTAKDVARTMAQYPDIWNPPQGRRPMSTARSPHQVKAAMTLGSDVTADDVVAWIREAFSARVNAFQDRMPEGQIEAMVQCALDNGLSPQSKASDGNTLFHWAAAQPNGLTLASVMMERGGDVHALNDEGKSVLDVSRCQVDVLAAARALDTGTRTGGAKPKR